MPGNGASASGVEAVAALAGRCCAGENLGRDDLLTLARTGAENPHELIYWAHRLRTRRFGRAVRFCSIVAGKLGGCGEDCAWCAQKASGGAIPKTTRTPLQTLEIAADRAFANGAADLGIVNSGRRPSQADLADLETAYQALRRRHPGMGQCASVGELTPEQARRLYDMGVRRYNHNLETSRRMYGKLVTTHSYDDRLATLRAARQAGIGICCGGIFGLGETWNDRVDMALTLRDEVHPEVVPLNFLHAIPGTALEGQPALAPMEILTIIAFFRLVLGTADIKIAGGREVNLRDLQSWIFYAGATSALIGDYLTTSGRPAADDLRMVADLGLEVVKEFPAAERPE